MPRRKPRGRRQSTVSRMSRKAKVLVFGPYGSGKTHFIGTADDDPRTHPMLLLDFEGGLDTLADREDLDVERIRDWDDYTRAYEKLTDPKGKRYRSVAIDSITETHIFALFDILEQEESKRTNPDLIQQGDYGIASVQLRRLIRTFRDLDLHVFITALERSDTDPREGTVFKPALSGKLADEIPGIVNVVGYLTVAEVEVESEETDRKRKPKMETAHVLLLKNYAKYRTKIRVPKTWTDVPDELVEPTVTDLLDILRIPMPEDEVEDAFTEDDDDGIIDEEPPEEEAKPRKPIKRHKLRSTPDVEELDDEV